MTGMQVRSKFLQGLIKFIKFIQVFFSYALKTEAYAYIDLIKSQ